MAPGDAAASKPRCPMGCLAQQYSPRSLRESREGADVSCDRDTSQQLHTMIARLHNPSFVMFWPADDIFLRHFGVRSCAWLADSCAKEERTLYFCSGARACRFSRAESPSASFNKKFQGGRAEDSELALSPMLIRGRTDQKLDK